jgi:arylsulfatase A-like enzyme
MKTLTLLILAFVLVDRLQGESRTGTRPNILLIMADDLGAENLAYYGNSTYSTPHLDRLSVEGALFKNAFATPVCTPTRAMILTGLYPNRTGFLERLDSRADVEKSNRLPVHLKTFGHLFQDAGYATAIAGKWHLGDFQKYPDQPTSHGFDEHCLWVQYWDGKRHSRYYGPHNWENGKYVVHGEHIFGPDYYTQFLMDFMERNHEQQKPFLAYFPMNLIHGPLVTPPGDQTAAEANYPDDLGKKERISGQMVHYMDKLDLTENTIVIFQSDNGHSAEDNAGISIENHPSGYPKGHYYLAHGGGGNTGKWIGHKGTLLEGGVRVPAIVSWPAKLPQGIVRDQAVTIMDWYPSLLQWCGVEKPDVKLDGRSLQSIIESPETPTAHPVIHFQWQQKWAVREGDWKLISETNRKSGAVRLSLHNLADDKPEVRDYAKRKPALVKRLAALHEEWHRDVSAPKVKQ